jgi:hypothetical protein
MKFHEAGFTAYLQIGQTSIGILSLKSKAQIKESTHQVIMRHSNIKCLLSEAHFRLCSFRIQSHHFASSLPAVSSSGAVRRPCSNAFILGPACAARRQQRTTWEVSGHSLRQTMIELHTARSDWRHLKHLVGRIKNLVAVTAVRRIDKTARKAAFEQQRTQVAVACSWAILQRAHSLGAK